MTSIRNRTSGTPPNVLSDETPPNVLGGLGPTVPQARPRRGRAPSGALVVAGAAILVALAILLGRAA
jgi:hypothetical protein